jgi:hypothetical protein
MADPLAPDARLRQLEDQVRALRHALITTVAWIAQSAGSPLTVKEAEQLIRLAEKGLSDD